MDRSRLESRIRLAPRDETDDVFQLMDDWVRQFEGDTVASWDQTDQRAPSPRRTAGDERPRSLAQMRSEWSRRSTESTRADDFDERPPAAPPPPKPEPIPLKAAGLLIEFTDSIGGTISLAHADGRFQHRGTVSVRGGRSIIESVSRDIGLPSHVAQAFEFIAGWFGFPFDSINLRTGDDHLISWGFWPIDGAGLARCLHEWKTQSPDDFAGYCGRFGIDVTAATEDARREPLLCVRLSSGEVQGRAAEWAMASDPQLLAVLARAGRDAAARKVQVESVVADSITPIMFHPWDPGGDPERLTLDVLKSARSIAALLYLVRRHGQRAALRAARTVTGRTHGQIDGEEIWLQTLVRSLRHMNREHDATEVLRIASSPELAAE